MAAASSKNSKTDVSESKAPVDAPTANQQGTRETIESVIVAFILAFLFRAFVAEAFVIPTGSMAPTLMGAHKDVFCEYCGQQYQASASSEFDANTGALKGVVTIASTCATCRGLNAYDLRNNRNHASFSGDRILVSKFDYVLHNPNRWDVFVFKWPTEARMNYIKRLVGLPGESLLIQDGDVYTKGPDAEGWSIARKPPTKIRAMRQIVSDTAFQADILIAQGWPSLWQPSKLPIEGAAQPGGWKVEQTTDSWSALLAPSETTSWLRYFHKYLDDASWRAILSKTPLPEIDPYASQLITDYLAYNSAYHWPRERIYDGRSLDPRIDSDTRALDIAIDQGMPLSGRSANDGKHWVGDLVGEFEVDITSDSGLLYLDLVEFGIHFQCQIDVATGIATLQPLAAEAETLPVDVFGSDKIRTARTSVRGPARHKFEFANVDDQIVLWIDDRVVEFDSPTAFDSHSIRRNEARRPYWSEADPLDAAPVGIGGQNLAMRVQRAKVYRDIYYIAVQGGLVANDYSDYDLRRENQLFSAVPDARVRGQLRSVDEAIEAIYSTPKWWSETNLFNLRGSREFQLEADQYFPMGDNSSHSSDARAWLGHHYVEQKFLLGKALLVFWPHTWNSPIPFTPNFSRMGLIR